MCQWLFDRRHRDLVLVRVRLAMGDVYDAEEFLDTASYSHVLRWARAILEREAVQQGLAATR